MKKSLIHYLGLLGVVSLLSYTAAVLFAPLAYPGYDWMAQAVSDLSAESAPSRMLWNQLASLYAPCGIVCCTVSCIAIKNCCSKLVRIGVYLFAVMNWVSAVGYTSFPLTEAGMPNGFQNAMHLVVTGAVVALSVLSLLLICVGGLRKNACRFLGYFAVLALVLMLLGAIGTNVVPPEYFGLPERFSTFAAVGFNAVLGIYLYCGLDKEKVNESK